MATCQFVRVRETIIRCSICGTEREHAGDPAIYIRICGTATGSSVLPKQSRPPLAPCWHRGVALESGSCNICGMKGQPFQIYACALYERCMERRYRNDRPHLKVCAKCPDYKVAATEPPPVE